MDVPVDTGRLQAEIDRMTSAGVLPDLAVASGEAGCVAGFCENAGEVLDGKARAVGSVGDSCFTPCARA